jgi:hypothetical protein
MYGQISAQQVIKKYTALNSEFEKQKYLFKKSKQSIQSQSIISNLLIS